MREWNRYHVRIWRCEDVHDLSKSRSIATLEVVHISNSIPQLHDNLRAAVKQADNITPSRSLSQTLDGQCGLS